MPEYWRRYALVVAVWCDGVMAKKEKITVMTPSTNHHQVHP
jgi:hypothetical protein